MRVEIIGYAGSGKSSISTLFNMNPYRRSKITKLLLYFFSHIFLFVYFPYAIRYLKIISLLKSANIESHYNYIKSFKHLFFFSIICKNYVEEGLLNFGIMALIKESQNKSLFNRYFDLLPKKLKTIDKVVIVKTDVEENLKYLYKRNHIFSYTLDYYKESVEDFDSYLEARKWFVDNYGDRFIIIDIDYRYENSDLTAIRNAIMS